MPYATISVDLDPMDVHLAGYGHRVPSDNLAYDVALPRLLELFARHAVQATFFLLGRDATAAASAFRSIRAAGHEAASHSVNHPRRLPTLSDDDLRHQLLASRSALEAALETEVIGFRAPDWAVDGRVLAAAVDAGYRYDASSMPSPVLTVGRAVLAVRGRRPADLLALRLPSSARRRPYRWRGRGREIVEFPVTVTPVLRMPVYHTLRYSLSRTRFERMLDGLVHRSESLSYPLHAIDALALEEDGVDPRLRAHPGVGLPLARKLSLLDGTLEDIVSRFAPATFAARQASMASGSNGQRLIRR